MTFNIRPMNRKKIHSCYFKFEKISKATQTNNKIVSNGYFANSDMRCGHDGLAKVAKKRKIDLSNLKSGELVVFVNTQQNKVKVFTTGYTFSYLRMPSNQKLNPGVISLIPKFFNGGKIDYTGALRQIIIKQFRRYDDSQKNGLSTKGVYVQ